MPLVFADPADYEKIDEMDVLVIEDAPGQIRSREITVQNKTKGTAFKALLELSEDETEIILSGGQLPYIKKMTQA